MRRSFLLISVVAVVVFLSYALLPSSAPAIMWNVDSATGKLLGASGVDVGGRVYDVMFVDGTCIGLFGGCDSSSDFTFQTAADASAASQALLDQVFLDPPASPGNFDTQPELTNGIASTSVAHAVTAYDFIADIPDTVLVYSADNFKSESSDGISYTTFDTNIDTLTSILITWAVWTPASTPVPEPTTILLLGSGLVGIGVLRRKLKQRQVGQLQNI